jgi:hypothetical protein
MRLFSLYLNILLNDSVSIETPNIFGEGQTVLRQAEGVVRSKGYRLPLQDFSSFTFGWKWL